MIQIKQRQSNLVTVTLWEKTTISDPIVYLFQFINTQSQEQKTFIAADTSDQVQRYNQFTIVDKENPNSLIGEVDLELKDQWHYFIYAQHSSTNLDPANAIELVEQGIVYVKGQEQDSYSYTPSINGYVYKPESE